MYMKQYWTLENLHCIRHTWYTRIADENENRVYRANRYDTIQYRRLINKTGFEYR